MLTNLQNKTPLAKIPENENKGGILVSSINIFNIVLSIISLKQYENNKYIIKSKTTKNSHTRFLNKSPHFPTILKQITLPNNNNMKTA